MLKAIHRYRKNIACFFMMLICVVFVGCIGTPVYADEGTVTVDNYEGTYPEDVDGDLEKPAYDCYRNICTNSAVKDCKAILDGTFFQELGLEGAMTQIYGVVKNVGIALLVVFFLAELLDKSTKQDYNLEILLRMLVKYFVMKTLMDNGLPLLKALLGISNALVGSMSDTGISPEQAEFLNKIGAVLNDSNFVMTFFLLMVGFIIQLLSQLLGLVIKAACYGRLFDITIRGGFAPIGCASMVQDGFTGHGLRYLKKYFASCLEGVVIIVILFIGSKMTSATLAGIFSPGNGIAFDNAMALVGRVVSLLLIPITELMVILKAGQVANEIAGV